MGEVMDDWTIWAKTISDGWDVIDDKLSEEVAKASTRELSDRYSGTTFMACPPAVYPWD
jgi:hypothetical protein